MLSESNFLAGLSPSMRPVWPILASETRYGASQVPRLPAPTLIQAADRFHAFADVRRVNYLGDLTLPVPYIAIALRPAA